MNNPTPLSLPVEIGASVELQRTFSMDDILAFARLSGDAHPFHTDPDYARAHGARDCFAHGLLTMSLFSTLGTRLYAPYGVPVVAYGYDRVRFVRPVFAGDTITARYRVTDVSVEDRKAFAECTCTNQDSATVLAAIHIAKFLPNSPAQTGEGP